MATWSPDVEALVRKAGDSMEKEMKDYVNPKKGTLRSILATAFASKTKVVPSLKKACEAANVPYTNDWHKDGNALVQLAAQNNSDAADKLKQWLPVSDAIADTFNLGIIKQTKLAKKTFGHLA